MKESYKEELAIHFGLEPGSTRHRNANPVTNPDGTQTVKIPWSRKVEVTKDGKKSVETLHTIQTIIFKDNNVISVTNTPQVI